MAWSRRAPRPVRAPHRHAGADRRPDSQRRTDGADAAATAMTPPDQVTGELTVFDWSGYDGPDFWTDFKDTYKNATVSSDVRRSRTPTSTTR